MNALKPCSYCGNTSFAYVPNIAVEAGRATTILGMPARTGGHDWWLLNMVS